MLRGHVVALACLTVLCMTPAWGAAQNDSFVPKYGCENGGFDLSPRVHIDYSTSCTDSLGSQQVWLRLAILWRGQPAWRPLARDDTVSTTSAAREFHRRALDALAAGGQWNGSQIGTLVYGSIHDPGGTWVEILGQRWAVPQRDSALVVLVDRVDSVGGPPFVLEAQRISSMLPSDILLRTWVSGDTTFTLKPRGSVQSALRALLSRLTTIREFWQ
jgi:hypothetical protein